MLFIVKKKPFFFYWHYHLSNHSKYYLISYSIISYHSYSIKYKIIIISVIYDHWLQWLSFLKLTIFSYQSTLLNVFLPVKRRLKYFLIPSPFSSANGLPIISLGAAIESIRLTDLGVSHSHNERIFSWIIFLV